MKVPALHMKPPDPEKYVPDGKRQGEGACSDGVGSHFKYGLLFSSPCALQRNWRDQGESSLAPKPSPPIERLSQSVRQYRCVASNQRRLPLHL